MNLVSPFDSVSVMKWMFSSWATTWCRSFGWKSNSVCHSQRGKATWKCLKLQCSTVRNTAPSSHTVYLGWRTDTWEQQQGKTPGSKASHFCLWGARIQQPLLSSHILQKPCWKEEAFPFIHFRKPLCGRWCYWIRFFPQPCKFSHSHCDGCHVILPGRTICVCRVQLFTECLGHLPQHPCWGGDKSGSLQFHNQLLLSNSTYSATAVAALIWLGQ